MSLYTLNQKKNLVLGVTIALGIFLAYSLHHVFTALLGAIILYTLFKPLYLYFAEKKSIIKGISASLVIVISFLIIILPFTILSFMIINKIMEFRNDPGGINELIKNIDDFAGSEFNEPLLVENILRNAEAWALRTFSTALNGVLEISLKITIMYFALYFMLTGYKSFENTVFKYMPFREQNSLIFAQELKNITYSNVIGQALISIVQGTLVGVGFLIFNLNDPVFWGVISCFLSFLPIVGAPLVFVPAGLIALSHGNQLSGFGIITWGFLLVTNIDNIMRLIIARKVANIHPLITIIGVVIGIPYFGILGLVFGPLLLSYFILLVKIYEIRYIKKQQINISDLGRVPIKND